MLTLGVQEHRRRTRSPVLHRCRHHVPFQHVRDVVDGLESAQSGSRTGLVEYHQMCSFGGGASGFTGDDQPYWTGMDLHCVCGFMLADCPDGCGGSSMGLCVAF